ncbi:MAG: addiction module protein [Gammaproteobacteria bacterium]
MNKKARDVYADALALSEKEQQKLRELLDVRSAGDFASPEIEQAWLEEAKRIDREVDEGRIDLIPAEEVMRELRKRYSV